MTEECGRPPDKIRGMEAELSLAQFQMLESILETTFPKCPGRPILRQLSEKIKISQNKLRNWFKWRINYMKQSTIDVADEINTGMVTSSSNPMVLNRVIFCPEVIQKYHCNFVPQYYTGSI